MTPCERVMVISIVKPLATANYWWILCDWPSHCSPNVWIEGHRSLFPVLRTYGGLRACCVTHLSTSAGRCLGTLETLLKFPKFHIRSMLFPMKCGLNSLKKKLDSLKECLQRLESRVPGAVGPSAPAPIMQTTNQPSQAATTGQGGHVGSQSLHCHLKILIFLERCEKQLPDFCIKFRDVAVLWNAQSKTYLSLMYFVVTWLHWTPSFGKIAWFFHRLDELPDDIIALIWYTQTHSYFIS